MKRPATFVTCIYAAAGFMWIYSSGAIFARLDLQKYHRFETMKGFLFVAVTAILLFYLLKYFYLDQKAKIRELEERETRLSHSEHRYRIMFDHGPLPKWIFDAATLQFLDVNEEAIHQYGYSRAQFLSMTLRDIRPKEDIDMLERLLKRIDRRNLQSFTGRVRHKKANGEIITVEIYTQRIEYKGRAAKVVTACDITEQEQYLQKIEHQNTVLREISWKQSHVVRAPLSSLLGFAGLLQQHELTQEERAFVVEGIIKSASDLDRLICETIHHADRHIQPACTGRCN